MSDLFQSRKFWVALIALFVIIVSSFLPNYKLDEQAAVDALILVVAYMVGIAVDPGNTQSKVAGMLKSRKFWAMTIGLTLIFLNSFNLILPFQLTADQLTSIAVVFGGYIAGVALEGKYQTEIKQIVNQIK